MHDLKLHPDDGVVRLTNGQSLQPVAAAMSRLRRWHVVLMLLEREAAAAKCTEIELLLGTTILAVEDAIAADAVA